MDKYHAVNSDPGYMMIMRRKTNIIRIHLLLTARMPFVAYLQSHEYQFHKGERERERANRLQLPVSFMMIVIISLVNPLIQLILSTIGHHLCLLSLSQDSQVYHN